MSSIAAEMAAAAAAAAVPDVGPRTALKSPAPKMRPIIEAEEEEDDDLGA